jgi:putative membrane protein
MSLIIKLLVNALALIITANIIKGIHLSSFVSALWAALILGAVNMIIRPIMLLITLPINFLTLGLFTLVINGLMLWITSQLVPGFVIDSFFAALFGALFLSIVSTILSFIFHTK